MTRDLNERKMFLSQVAFHSNLRALGVIYTATDAATKCVLTYFAFSFDILKLRILPSKKEH